ncbi:hypothetical protein GCM10027594_01490 [Hymenobacter agri]
MKKLVVFGLLLVGGAARGQQASLSFGPRVGLNLATYHSAQLANSETRGYRAGFEAGLAGTVGFGHLALQAAVLYAQRGATSHAEVTSYTGTGPGVGTTFDGHSRLNYLTVPVALAYTQHTDGQGAQVFAGPYFGLLLNGRYDNTITPQGAASINASGAITPVNNAGPDLATNTGGAYTRRFDAGLQGGVGYRYHGLLVQASYSLGLLNLAPSYTYNMVPVSSRPHYNRAFHATLTYLFALKG